MSVEEALAELRACAGTQFDPTWSNAFCEEIASLPHRYGDRSSAGAVAINTAVCSRASVSAAVRYRHRLEAAVEQLAGLVGGVVGVQQHDAELHVAAPRGGDDRAPGAVRVAGLQPGDAPVALAHQRVVVVEEQPAALDRELQDRALAAGDAADAAQVQVGARQRGEIGGARVVARVLQAVRGREAGAAEPELRRALVHQPHEAGHRAGRVLRERDGGVVAGHEQQAVQQRLELHPLAALAGRPPPSRACARARRVIRTRSCGSSRSTTSSAVIIFVRLAIGSRRSGVAAPQHAAGAHVEQQAGARLAHEAQLHDVRPGRDPPRSAMRRWRDAAAGGVRAWSSSRGGSVAEARGALGSRRRAALAPIGPHREGGPRARARAARPAAAARSGERRAAPTALQQRRRSVTRHRVASRTGRRSAGALSGRRRTVPAPSGCRIRTGEITSIVSRGEEHDEAEHEDQHRRLHRSSASRPDSAVDRSAALRRFAKSLIVARPNRKPPMWAK